MGLPIAAKAFLRKAVTGQCSRGRKPATPLTQAMNSVALSCEVSSMVVFGSNIWPILRGHETVTPDFVPLSCSTTFLLRGGVNGNVSSIWDVHGSLPQLGPSFYCDFVCASGYGPSRRCAANVNAINGVKTIARRSEERRASICALVFRATN